MHFYSGSICLEIVHTNIIQYTMQYPNHGILRGYDNCLQITIIECVIRDGSDIGGDDHVGASTTRRAAAIMEGRRHGWGYCSSFCWCVENDGGRPKRIIS